MPHGTGERHSSLAGQLLADRYRLDAPIEAGRMGEVWSARDTVLNRPVAVKMINQAHAADEAFVSRFRAESRHAAALSHSGVAQVFDYGEQEGTSLPCPYLVMEHVSGRPLSELVAQAGVLPADVVLDITAQAARALQAAHDIGITHRDIRPANLLVTDDGLVKITDFGGPALTVGSQVATMNDTGLVRSAVYLSPEQAGGKPATQASDIYSLGVVAYECAAGRLPFAGETLQALAVARAEGEPRPLPEGVPAPVRSLIMWMIARDPRLRPGSARAVAETASALRQQLPSSAGPPASAAQTRPGGPGTLAGGAGPLAAGAGRPARTGLARRTSPVAGRAGPATVQAGPSAAGIAPAAGTGALAAGTGPAMRTAATGTGADPATVTVPQPRAGDAERGISRRRWRRAMTAAAVTVGVTAVAAAIAAVMIGGNSGKPPAVTRNTDTPAPGVQAVVPALGPTAHPGRAHASRRPRKTSADRNKTAQPAQAPGAPARAPAPAPGQPASSPPARHTGPSPSPPPGTSPPPDSAPPSPPPSSPPPSPASSSQRGPGTSAPA